MISFCSNRREEAPSLITENQYMEPLHKSSGRDRKTPPSPLPSPHRMGRGRRPTDAGSRSQCMCEADGVRQQKEAKSAEDSRTPGPRGGRGTQSVATVPRPRESAAILYRILCTHAHTPLRLWPHAIQSWNSRYVGWYVGFKKQLLAFRKFPTANTPIRKTFALKDSAND
jgi:hypothetical protein